MEKPNCFKHKESALVELLVTVAACSAGITLLDSSFVKPFCYPVIMVVSLCLYAYFAMRSEARTKYPAIIALVAFGLSLLFTLDRIVNLPLGWSLLADLVATVALLVLFFRKFPT